MSMPPHRELALRLAARARHARGAAVQRLPAAARLGLERVTRARRPVRRQLRPAAQRARGAGRRRRCDSLQLDELRWMPDRPAVAEGARAHAPAAAPRGDGAAGLRRRAALRASTAANCERAGPELHASTPCASCRPSSRGADWFLIIGQDQYAGLHTWHGWQELLRAGHAGGRQPRPGAAGGQRRCVPARAAPVRLPLPHDGHLAPPTIRERVARGRRTSPIWCRRGRTLY